MGANFVPLQFDSTSTTIFLNSSSRSGLLSSLHAQHNTLKHLSIQSDMSDTASDCSDSEQRRRHNLITGVSASASTAALRIPKVTDQMMMLSSRVRNCIGRTSLPHCRGRTPTSSCATSPSRNATGTTSENIRIETMSRQRQRESERRHNLKNLL